MKVTCILNDCSKSPEEIKIHSALIHGEHVELEVNGERYEVNGNELISAIQKCMLGFFKY